MSNPDPIGIIGGSGLYAMEGMVIDRTETLQTPFGPPSDAYVIGRLDDIPVVFLPRHGVGHKILPSELNFRANLYGFKSLGVERLLSVSAVGSLREEYAPRHVVFPDQFFDRTRHRVDTFFGNGIVAHVAFAHPICSDLLSTASDAAREAGATVHRGGTYLCMEGPLFSTRAESFVYRSWGMDIIGMTNLQEAKLAREAEMCYATIAMVTDYDCWREGTEDVTGTHVLEVLRENAAMAQSIVRKSVARLANQSRNCECASVLDTSIVTDLSLVPQETLSALEPILRRYRTTRGI
ncbi:MAG TPA: S-methyl-5'-thioadenosine phosphorylase [Thermoanaerobaculia bacterium]|nr:S-methyl-5'-thioadenosine phosphorylase [Thermoanaerobaculia bacterium]HUM29713.1 S-methyl-5'-thioadenosine phosphorylase [Thermoanaerobaculia bacterium]HXK67013.1 S-methyl-5'-thioadenosine phosphorylase [Thermoanaerobaculia bacterium]